MCNPTTILYLIALMWVGLFIHAFGQDVPPLPPTNPAAYSADFVGQVAYDVPAPPPTNSITLTTEAEWELTFEWSPDVAFTNATAYPIVVRVPFEHDSGFVRVVARKALSAPKEDVADTTDYGGLQ